MVHIVLGSAVRAVMDAVSARSAAASRQLILRRRRQGASRQWRHDRVKRLMRHLPNSKICAGWALTVLPALCSSSLLYACNVLSLHQACCIICESHFLFS